MTTDLAEPSTIERPTTWAGFAESYPDAANAIDAKFLAKYGTDLVDDIDSADKDVLRLAKFITWQGLLAGFRRVAMHEWLSE